MPNGAHINQESPNMALKRMDFNDEANGRKQTIHSVRATFRNLADTHQVVYDEEMRLLLNWSSEYVMEMVER